MFGFSQQHNNVDNNGGTSSLSDDEDDLTRFFDYDTAPGQNLDELFAPSIVTQLPPMLPAEATQHHHTLPQHVNQIVSSSPVDLPSHVPIEALVQQNGGSSVQRQRGKGLQWTVEEHMKFLVALDEVGKGDWITISKHIGTKSSTQVASHAQKYYLRQKAKKKIRKSIHDITLNTISHQDDTQNSTPHPDPEIQPVHEIHQMQEMPPNSMTHQMSGFEYFANQQVHEIQQMQDILSVYPSNNITHQMGGFEHFVNQQVHEMPVYPPNNMTHQMSGFEHFANQQVHEMQQMQDILSMYPSNNMIHQMNGSEYFVNQQVHEMPVHPPNNMTHQMSGFQYLANQQVHKIQQMQDILPAYPSNNMTHQMSGFECSNKDFGRGCYKPEYPPNNTSSSNN
ncbi:hypothetical protein AAZX31_08G107400 [Glycine max]|uniref:Uncharacterized protein n=1 Tax=Glycine max TaxID=3847 RepID=K7L609_SOYBN|nr:hypothetical protein JHK85_021483 [Glycine max]KAG5136301.1 hypothetical protein JHK82_021032 [Glycine max]KAH1050678.1 hypothetical protein GYH30_020901 [Glycine max]KAH1236744.1 Transcription factor KUA1 [Glycine max]